MGTESLKDTYPRRRVDGFVLCPHRPCCRRIRAMCAPAGSCRRLCRTLRRARPGCRAIVCSRQCALRYAVLENVVAIYMIFSLYFKRTDKDYRNGMISSANIHSLLVYSNDFHMLNPRHAFTACLSTIIIRFITSSITSSRQNT